MGRRRTLAIPLGAAGAAVIVERHGRGAASGRSEPGGVLMGDAVGYDALSRLILGSFYRSIAADVAQAAPNGAWVLEVGCGPGHLSTRLARQHGLDMTIPLGPTPARARREIERLAELGVAELVCHFRDLDTLRRFRDEVVLAG
jgi:hypothetical protein